MNTNLAQFITLTKENIYFRLIKRLLVIYLLFTLSRLLFLLFNYNYYHERTFEQLLRIFLGGLKFDTTAILYTNSVYILLFGLPFKFRYNTTYQKVGKWLYFITNGIVIGANCIDIVYFRFTLQRTTFCVFQEFSHGEKLGKVFFQSFLENWYLLLVYTGLIAIMVLLYGKPLKKSSVLIKSPYLYYPVCTVIMALMAGLSVAGIRGGFLHSIRPITLSNAAQYIVQPVDIPLVVNTPFSIYLTIESQGVRKMIYFDNEQELDAVFTPIHLPADSIQAENKMNVMIFILESFGKENMRFFNKELDGGEYKGYTPFLDSIADQSLTFRYSYANGRKSIDAQASVFLSVPAIPEPYFLSPYFNNKNGALPHLLNEEGYETAFFCGQPNIAMGFKAYCNLLGFQKFFGMTEYGNDADYDGIWGIWDEEFLQFTAKEMSELKEPFLSSVFTVSSHHPFKIPARYEDIFPEGVLPIHKCIRYTDNALRLFFKTASQQSWYDNTLFVFVADHINGTVHEEYNNPVNQAAIPIIFYKPDGSLKDYRDEVAQQLDIMPTVLGYLNYDKPYLAFGFDVNKNKNSDRFAVNYHNGFYQLHTDKYFLIFDGEKTIGLYDIVKNDNVNIMNENKDVVAELEPKIKVFLQQLTVRLIDDKLTVEEEATK